MKKVEEFQETQKLMEEFKGFDNKVSELENQIKQNENSAKIKIERLESQLELTWEDVEFEIDRKSLQEEIEKQIKNVKSDLDKENKEINKEIKESKDSKKYFRTDAHFKTITMEIEEMKKEVSKEELDLKKKDLELQEFYNEEQHENPLKWQEIYKEQDALRKNIAELNAKIEEYSKFKEELNSINLTPEEYKKMFEREADRMAREVKAAKAEEKKPEEKKSEPTEPETTKPESTKSEPTKPESTKPEPTKSEPTKPEPTKPESTKPEPTKPEPTEPELTKPEPTKTEIEEKDLVLISFNAKKKSYHLVINGKEYSEDSKDVLELIESEEFDMFKAKLFNDYREAKGLEHVDPCVAYLLEKVDNQLGQHRLDNYMKALGKEEKMSDFTTISYDVNGIFGRKYDSQLSEDILRAANYHGENKLAALIEKNRFTQFMEKHPKWRKAYETISKIGKGNKLSLGKKNKQEKLDTGDKQKDDKATDKDFIFHVSILQNSIENVQTEDQLKDIYEQAKKAREDGKINQQEFASLQEQIGKKGADLKGKNKKDDLKIDLEEIKKNSTASHKEQRTEPEEDTKKSFKERLKFTEKRKERRKVKKAQKSKYSVKEKFKDGVRKAKEVRNARKNKPLEGEKIEDPRPRNLEEEAKNAKTVDYVEL